jgi:GH15 family glucan-1,4-alpha-glucosidase
VVNLRDASLAASAFLRLGFRNEASAFMSWLAERCEEAQKSDGSLQLMYTIHGATDFEPITLAHIAGYKKSGPVKIGNPSAKRFSLYMYGTLLIAIYLSNIHAEPISFEFWKFTRKLVDYVCTHWQEPDEGMWSEERGTTEAAVRQQFVISKVLCWVCVDRGIKLAKERSFPAPFNTWKRIRDEIYTDVYEHGYNKQMGSFVQVYGSKHLDAALLLMPVIGFIAPTDPKFLSTLDAITRSVNLDGLTSNSLIHRSNADNSNANSPQVTTSICTFWVS